MRKRVFCLLLAAGVMSSSIIVNAGSLPKENEAVQETLIEEGVEAETEQPVEEPETDKAEEADEIPEEITDEMLPEEILQESAEEQKEDSQEESGDDIQETPQEEELLGDQILIRGGSDQGSAKEISLDTEYASQTKSCWYKFTTKSEPAFYRLWLKNNGTGRNRYHIYLKDGMKEIWDIGPWSDGEAQSLGKLEPNHTYYIEAGDGNEPDFYYLFSVTSYDDPEGDTVKEAYPLPLGEVYSTSIAASDGYTKDSDYYAIQTAEAGHYRIKLGNESLRDNNGFRIMTRYNEELEKKTWISQGRTSDICLTLEGNTLYYIQVWCNNSGFDMNYNILAERLTDHEGDTKETAYDLREGEVYEGDLCARDDMDFYRLIPRSSGKYIIDISNTTKSSSKDYTIYTERNEPLKSGRVYSESKESVKLELTAGKVYYVYVHANNNDNNTGKYLVSYSREFPFSDVAVQPGWRYDSIKYVLDNNIMNGISGTTRFDPDEPLTRAMFATVLYRMAGEPAVQFKNIFTDVPAGRYYSNAVIWAYNTGIVQGMSKTLYGSEKNITREQIAKMLREYGRVQGYTMNENADLSSFPDRADVSGWATGYIKWAVGSGMVTGKNVGGTYYLDPKGNATRVECAAMLTRFMKRYK